MHIAWNNGERSRKPSHKGLIVIEEQEITSTLRHKRQTSLFRADMRGAIMTFVGYRPAVKHCFFLSC